MVNIFVNNPAFAVAAMTDAINKFPNTYGRLNELGLMPARGVTTPTIVVEEKNGILNLLPSVARGGPSTKHIVGKRNVRAFVIPHIPHEDAVLPEDVAGIRAFGSENEMEGVNMRVAEKLQTMRAEHAITLEWMRMSALNGIIQDGAGLVLYNLYTEFEITPKTLDFQLNVPTTDVRAKCLQLKRYIEDHLLGETYSRVHVLVSPEFYDKLTSHPEVKEAFKYYNQSQNLSGDYRTLFTFAGVTFEEYRGVATKPDGTVMPFLQPNHGRAFPLGTTSTFRTYFAPADFNETVNTIGIELYAKTKEREYGRGMDIHTQSNPLPICLRPELLVDVFTS